MKRIISVFLLLTVLALSFCACSIGTNEIEDYEWRLRVAMCTDGETFTVSAASEEDSAHPEAKIVEVVLTAIDGKITVTDRTNNKSYEGTYEVIGRNPNETDYSVKINGKEGYATVAMTKYADGSKEPTLPINLGDYSLYFYG